MHRAIRQTLERFAAAFGEELLERLVDLATDGGFAEPCGGPPRRPKPGPKETPYSVLGLLPGATLEVCEAVYRARAKTSHPDAGGSPAEFRRLTQAIECLRKVNEKAR